MLAIVALNDENLSKKLDGNQGTNNTASGDTKEC
jgi:hypothetical protein